MPTRGGNGHLLIFVAVFVALAGCASLVSYIVNPSGVFGPGYFKPIVWIDRDQKSAAYNALTVRPRFIVLGSSRAMKISPAEIRSRTGLPAFNFAVNSATVDDYLAIARYCLARDRSTVERILIGVDPEAFHTRWPTDPRLLRSRYLAAVYCG